MKKIKDSKMAKQELIDSLRLRIRSLQNARQHYQQNPNLMNNVRIMNIDLIQNDIELLKKILSIFTRKHHTRKNHPLSSDLIVEKA